MVTFEELNIINEKKLENEVTISNEEYTWDSEARFDPRLGYEWPNDPDGTIRASANRYIGSAFTILRVLLMFVSIICLLKVLINSMKNVRKKTVNFLEMDDTEEKKKPVGIYIFISILLFFISGIMSITTKFAKPIIYIYPEEETEVKIKVKNPEKLTCTYPKYKDGWNVLAKPNGDLIDLETKRNLYALYWEGINKVKPNFKEGFIVEGEKVTEFLEEKLEILGLNEREAEEFIVYWLPILEKNKYNYIRFETLEEINEKMELEIIPKPETLIRINMEFKGIRKPFSITEQKLERVERKGYTVIEWGGTKL